MSCQGQAVYQPGPVAPDAGEVSINALDGIASPPPGLAGSGPRWRPLRDLDRPGQLFTSIGPNWFASVMGTGIVATAAATLPVKPPGLHVFATVFWLLAAAWLAVLTAAWAVHWIAHRANARGHADNPVMAQYFGAPPMALLTVGAGTLLFGPPLIGLRAALLADAGLWAVGTITGLASSLAIPYLMFTRHRIGDGDAFGGWLMPVVPPMVSAATGALLIPHLPSGQPRLTMLLGCYAMFGLSLIASVIVITTIWQQLVRYKPGPALMIPTLWIVLGPLGQSITAVNGLGAVAHLALPYGYAAPFAVLGLVYGIPVWGFAALWAALAAALTVRAARNRLPFGLTWWSFTFPVGTCVTGTSALAAYTGATAFRWTAIAGYAALVTAWAVVGASTARGAWRGRLFLPPSPAPQPATQQRRPSVPKLVPPRSGSMCQM